MTPKEAGCGPRSRGHRDASSLQAAELLQKERGHLEVDLFFFLSLSFCIFHQSFINNRQNPWGKTSQPEACCKYSRKREGKREGRLNLLAFIFNEGYFNLF